MDVNYKIHDEEIVSTSSYNLHSLKLENVDTNYNSKAYLFFKRALDILFSSVATVALLPLFVVISIAIIIDDPKAPPLYVSERCGRNGKPFKFYKFRSMCANAEKKLPDVYDKNEADGPVFKIKNDPRITKVGRFLRMLSIDEFPQLLNILKGDMSIVGPRPPLPGEVEKYNDYQHQRLSVKPGLTCFWQVSKNRNDMKFDDWVALDLKYIKECNFWLDIKLIFKTVIVVFRCDGN